jgi:YHS domain-containing protein
MHRSLRLLAVFGLAFLLTACGAMRAQNPGAALQPVNAVTEGEDASVMLKGADVVAYFTQNRYVQGQPSIKSVYQGVTFRFSTAENKALFDRDPAKYQPEFGGYCANGLAYGIPWGGDADRFKMVGGKLYIFGGQGSLDAWNLDEPRNLALARKYWDEEVKGSNSFWQRTKRLIFRVPHYKNGDELAREVEAARKKG